MEEKKSEESGSLESSANDGSSNSSGSAQSSGASITDISTNANSGMPKPEGGIKALWHKFDIYLLGFFLLFILAGIIAAVNYLNTKKVPPTPTPANKNLTTSDLKQLANQNATVGDSGQTVTIQGNADFTGQVLVRNNLDVAGDIKLGGVLTVQNMTAAGTANLTTVQAKSLQVAQDTTMKGTLTIAGNLNVAGSSTFNGPATMNNLSVTNLTLAGNAQLTVPNHVAFTGGPPTRAEIFHPTLGGGGSASVNGSDTAGTININTGSGTQAGCFLTLNFNKHFSKTPHVMVSPVGQAAGQTDYYTTRTTTQFQICTANAAPANQVFAFDYFITD